MMYPAQAQSGFIARKATSSKKNNLTQVPLPFAHPKNLINDRHTTGIVASLYASCFFHFSSIFFLSSALSAFTGGKRSRHA